MGLSSPAFAQSAAVDPAGSSPITGALRWIQGTLLGNLAYHRGGDRRGRGRGF